MFRRRILSPFIFRVFDSNPHNPLKELVFDYGRDADFPNNNVWPSELGESKETGNVTGDASLITDTNNEWKGYWKISSSGDGKASVVFLNFNTYVNNTDITLSCATVSSYDNDFLGICKLDKITESPLYKKFSGTQGTVSEPKTFTINVPTAGSHFIKLYYYTHNDDQSYSHGVVTDSNSSNTDRYAYFKLTPINKKYHYVGYYKPVRQKITIRSYSGWHRSADNEWRLNDKNNKYSNNTDLSYHLLPTGWIHLYASKDSTTEIFSGPVGKQTIWVEVDINPNNTTRLAYLELREERRKTSFNTITNTEEDNLQGKFNSEIIKITQYANPKPADIILSNNTIGLPYKSSSSANIVTKLIKNVVSYTISALNGFNSTTHTNDSCATDNSNHYSKFTVTKNSNKGPGNGQMTITGAINEHTSITPLPSSMLNIVNDDNKCYCDCNMFYKDDSLNINRRCQVFHNYSKSSLSCEDTATHPWPNSICKPYSCTPHSDYVSCVTETEFCATDSHKSCIGETENLTCYCDCNQHDSCRCNTDLTTGCTGECIANSSNYTCICNTNEVNVDGTKVSCVTDNYYKKTCNCHTNVGVNKGNDIYTQCAADKTYSFTCICHTNSTTNEATCADTEYTKTCSCHTNTSDKQSCATDNTYTVTCNCNTNTGSNEYPYRTCPTDTISASKSCDCHTNVYLPMCSTDNTYTVTCNCNTNTSKKISCTDTGFSFTCKCNSNVTYNTNTNAGIYCTSDTEFVVLCNCHNNTDEDGILKTQGKTCDTDSTYIETCTCYTNLYPTCTDTIYTETCECNSNKAVYCNTDTTYTVTCECNSNKYPSCTDTTYTETCECNTNQYPSCTDTTYTVSVPGNKPCPTNSVSSGTCNCNTNSGVSCPEDTTYTEYGDKNCPSNGISSGTCICNTDRWTCTDNTYTILVSGRCDTDYTSGTCNCNSNVYSCTDTSYTTGCTCNTNRTWVTCEDNCESNCPSQDNVGIRSCTCDCYSVDMNSQGVDYGESNEGDCHCYYHYHNGTQCPSWNGSPAGCRAVGAMYIIDECSGYDCRDAWQKFNCYEYSAAYPQCMCNCNTEECSCDGHVPCNCKTNKLFMDLGSGEWQCLGYDCIDSVVHTCADSFSATYTCDCHTNMDCSADSYYTAIETCSCNTNVPVNPCHPHYWGCSCDCNMEHDGRSCMCNCWDVDPNTTFGGTTRPVNSPDYTIPHCICNYEYYLGFDGHFNPEDCHSYNYSYTQTNEAANCSAYDINPPHSTYYNCPGDINCGVNFREFVYEHINVNNGYTTCGLVWRDVPVGNEVYSQLCIVYNSRCISYSSGCANYDQHTCLCNCKEDLCECYGKHPYVCPSYSQSSCGTDTEAIVERTCLCNTNNGMTCDSDEYWTHNGGWCDAYLQAEVTCECNRDSVTCETDTTWTSGTASPQSCPTNVIDKTCNCNTKTVTCETDNAWTSSGTSIPCETYNTEERTCSCNNNSASYCETDSTYIKTCDCNNNNATYCTDTVSSGSCDCNNNNATYCETDTTHTKTCNCNNNNATYCETDTTKTLTCECNSNQYPSCGTDTTNIKTCICYNNNAEYCETDNTYIETCSCHLNLYPMYNGVLCGSKCSDTTFTITETRDRYWQTYCGSHGCNSDQNICKCHVNIYYNYCDCHTFERCIPYHAPCVCDDDNS